MKTCGHAYEWKERNVLFTIGNIAGGNPANHGVPRTEYGAHAGSNVAFSFEIGVENRTVLGGALISLEMYELEYYRHKEFI